MFTLIQTSSKVKTRACTRAIRDQVGGCHWGEGGQSKPEYLHQCWLEIKLAQSRSHFVDSLCWIGVFCCRASHRNPGESGDWFQTVHILFLLITALHPLTIYSEDTSASMAWVSINQLPDIAGIRQAWAKCLHANKHWLASWDGRGTTEQWGSPVREQSTNRLHDSSYKCDRTITWLVHDLLLVSFWL